MLAHVVDTWRGAGFAEIVVVLGHGAKALRERVEEGLLRLEESERTAGTREGSLATGDGDGEGAARPLDAGGGGGGGGGAAPPPPPPPPVRFVENPDWESGMFSSVRAGLAAIRPESTHAALSPADLPFLGKSSLRTILSATNLPEADSRTLLVPVCGRRRGHPLVIPAALAARVLAWPADARLNRLFAEPDVKVLHLEGFDETILADVDRPADLAAASVAAGGRA
jgi:CTP:molybdopterin cytidylyltransferase MocA